MQLLARRRVPLGFLFGGLVIWLADPTTATLIAGGIVGIAGEGLRIWAAGHISKSREVTSSGPYRWFAHPLYVGSSVMSIGLAIAAGSIVAALLIAVYMGATIAAAVRSEEAFLRGKFGDEYASYRAGRAAADAGASTRRFSWQQALTNREYRALAGFLLVVLLLLAKATYNGRLG